MLGIPKGQWTGAPGVECSECNKCVVSTNNDGEFQCEICGYAWTKRPPDPEPVAPIFPVGGWWWKPPTTPLEALQCVQTRLRQGDSFASAWITTMAQCSRAVVNGAGDAVRQTPALATAIAANQSFPLGIDEAHLFMGLHQAINNLSSGAHTP